MQRCQIICRLSANDCSNCVYFPTYSSQETLHTLLNSSSPLSVWRMYFCPRNQQKGKKNAKFFCSLIAPITAVTAKHETFDNRLIFLSIGRIKTPHALPNSSSTLSGIMHFVWPEEKKAKENAKHKIFIICGIPFFLPMAAKNTQFIVTLIFVC